MTYVPRQLSDRLMRLVQSFPVVVISGARQVGKSTLLKNAFPPETDYVLFDPVTDVENARQDPELFLANHPRDPSSSTRSSTFRNLRRPSSVSWTPIAARGASS